MASWKSDKIAGQKSNKQQWKMGCPKKQEEAGSTMLGHVSHVVFGIIAIQFNTQLSRKHKQNTRLQTTGQPKVEKLRPNLGSSTPGGKFHKKTWQLVAPVARKPRTATMAHKGAMEGPDFTGASPGVFGRWWMMPLMGSEFRRNHLGMFKALYHK